MLVDKVVAFFFLQIFANLPQPSSQYEDDETMHPHFHDGGILRKRSIGDGRRVEENSADYWMRNGQEALKTRLSRKINENVAKNVILFMGDGMSIPTISAARVYMGGEEKSLAFDHFPYSGLSKTYCIDHQVADSACSSTAYLGGVKANLGTIGVTGAVARDDCASMTNSTNFVWSIAHLSQIASKMTGFVTTARVTHASPAGVYAHTAERNWESDIDIINQQNDPTKCQDVATQLIYGATGRNLNVILGGGRVNFIPSNTTDVDGGEGRRVDGVNLIEEWLLLKNNSNANYVSNRNELLGISNETDYLLGLFNSDHCSYNLERDPAKEPSLAEMTAAAIGVLQKSPRGYFLFVEGARIDMGHHQARAHMALDETVEFSKAIQAAVDLTDQEDTLIVATSDHAHTLSYSGYAKRGDDILGIGGKGTDDLPYTILSYANGPGYKTADKNGKRYDIRNDNLLDLDYKYPGLSPMDSETHGGDDVGIFARGPWAHLFTGVMEQNVIPQLMSFASCVGRGATACDSYKQP